MKADHIVAAFFVAIVILFLSMSFWLPCGFYQWAASKDIPGRCISNFQK